MSISLLTDLEQVLTSPSNSVFTTLMTFVTSADPLCIDCRRGLTANLRMSNSVHRIHLTLINSNELDTYVLS